MGKFKVDRKQNLLDVCLQIYGSTQLLFKLSKDNGLKIDDDINIGDELTFDESFIDTRIADKIGRDKLRMINPVIGQSSTVQTWTDGLGNAFTDGLGNFFSDK